MWSWTPVPPLYWLCHCSKLFNGSAPSPADAVLPSLKLIHLLLLHFAFLFYRKLLNIKQIFLLCCGEVRIPKMTSNLSSGTFNSTLQLHCGEVIVNNNLWLSLQTWFQQLLHKAAGINVGWEDTERFWSDVNIRLSCNLTLSESDLHLGWSEPWCCAKIQAISMKYAVPNDGPSKTVCPGTAASL